MSNSIIAPLTFGVEFEFIVKSLPTNIECPEDPEKDDRPAKWDGLKNASGYKDTADIHQQIANVFQKYGIANFYYNCKDASEAHKRWNIDEDISVEVAGDDKNSAYQYSNVEVVSPIYYSSQSRKNMALDEIQRVLSIIRNEFRVHVPSTAGMHIHVGNGTKGFTKSHMQSLLSILYVFERQIQILHPNRQVNEPGREVIGYGHLFFSPPSQCNLGAYLLGKTWHDDTHRSTSPTDDPKIIEYDALNQKDLSMYIIDAVHPPPFPNHPPEYSQAQRFVRREERHDIARSHVRIRQMFATGAESMDGIGATQIANGQPGAIAQALFKNNSLPVPLPTLNPNLPLGNQIYSHLAHHLKLPLNSQIEEILKNPGLSSNLTQHRTSVPIHAEYPDPRLLLAPKILSQQKTMNDLDYCSGIGERYVAYNIHGMTSGLDGRNRPTIEFRQHQGTLDANRSAAWIQTVIGMVEWTRTATPTTIVELLKVGAKCVPGGDFDFDVIDLLRYMGLDQPADYYEKQFFVIEG